MSASSFLRRFVPLALAVGAACNAVTAVGDLQFTRACSPDECKVCDPTLGCVECSTNSHCGPSLPACVDHKCLECASNADCKDADHPACLGNRCRECAIDEDCYPNLYGACKNGICIDCNDDQDCVMLDLGSACQAEICVECVKSADCTASGLGSTCTDGFCFCAADTECTNPAYPTCLDGYCQ